MRVEQSVSDWLLMNGGVPQGTRVSPIVFIFVVNDLLEGRHQVKFVDDTASWECCHVTGRDSSLQDVTNDSAEWSESNMMQLNVGKTKEMIATFSQKHLDAGIPLLKIEGRELERISCVKVLGVMISDDLSWAAHVEYICPNTNRRLYFVCMLRRAGASCADLPHLLQGVRAQCRGVRQRCVAHRDDWGAGRPHQVCPEMGSAHH